jgi:hypothetical protein
VGRYQSFAQFIGISLQGSYAPCEKQRAELMQSSASAAKMNGNIHKAKAPARRNRRWHNAAL